MSGEKRTITLGGGVVVPYPEPADNVATKIGKANVRRDTRAELLLRSALHRRGLRFRKDLLVRCMNGLKVRPDVVFTRQRIAVFVDGCFWHGCPRHGSTPRRNKAYWVLKLEGNRSRDRRVDAALRADGWYVERIWEHEESTEASARIAKIVAARRAVGQVKRSWPKGSTSPGSPATARMTDSASRGGTALPS